MRGDVSVRRVLPSDWMLLRDVRLRALATDPQAFGSTYAREEQFSPGIWHSRIVGGAWFVASSAGSPAGLAALTVRPDVPGVGDVTAVWVAPEFRRSGVGDRLFEELIGEGRRLGLRTLSLYVVVGNTAAERLYLRHGFVRTGRSKSLAHTPGVGEVELRCSL